MTLFVLIKLETSDIWRPAGRGDMSQLMSNQAGISPNLASGSFAGLDCHGAAPEPASVFQEQLTKSN